jgi:hypothetical protein
MYMRCAARSSSTSSFASTGRKRTVIDPFRDEQACVLLHRPDAVATAVCNNE